MLERDYLRKRARRRVMTRPVIAALFAGLMTFGSVPVEAGAAQPSPPEISMSIVSVSPNSPAISSTNKPLTVELSLTNISGQPLNGVTITGTRGEPLVSTAGLDAAIASPTEPDPATAEPISTAHPVTVNLAADASQTVDFTTTTSVTNGPAGICLCTPAGVYPLYFAATVGGATIGSAQTYLPAFYQQPQKAQVTWIWPLIDRPHRLTADTTFFDDVLTDSIKGGRLDRALQTLEILGSLAPSAAVTVVLDPELLDELLVMADPTTPYTVHAPGGAAQPAVGHAAAVEWLGRFRTVLDNDPALRLAFTPFADPDVNSVLSAGLTLAPMPPAMAARISAWLGTRVPLTNFAWPVGGVLSATAGRALAATGYATALLGPDAVPAQLLPDDGRPLRATSDGNTLAVLSTPKDIAKAVSTAVSLGAPTDATQNLVAQLAVLVAADVTAGNRSSAHHLALAPPRYVDPDPQAAAASIAATTNEFWTQGVVLAAHPATGGQPVSMARLAKSTAQTPQLSLATLEDATSVIADTATLASLFTASNPVVTALPAGVQRLESSAWALDSSAGQTFADALTASITKIKRSVFIVKPSGSYTLASNNSPLPLTIQNDSSYEVRVVVDVSAVNRLPGFSARARSYTVDPHSKLPIHMPTSVQRSGRIQVQAQLRTLSGASLGEPVQLSVRSTALGTIGLIITIVSGVVLALALVRRFWSRYRHRSAPHPPSAPAPDLAASGTAP